MALTEEQMQRLRSVQIEPHVPPSPLSADVQAVIEVIRSKGVETFTARDVYEYLRAVAGITPADCPTLVGSIGAVLRHMRLDVVVPRRRRHGAVYRTPPA